MLMRCDFVNSFYGKDVSKVGEMYEAEKNPMRAFYDKEV